VIVDLLIVDLVPCRDKGKHYRRRGRNCSDKLEPGDAAKQHEREY
jgi:hypothetical protein